MDISKCSNKDCILASNCKRIQGKGNENVQSYTFFDCVNNGVWNGVSYFIPYEIQHVYIMRGHSGSGKSTVAQMIKEQSENKCEIVSADDYFYDKGVYKFDFDKLKDAHLDCYKKFKKALLNGNDVVVDNTNTKYSEFKKYIEYCLFKRVPYSIVDCSGDYQNIHNVPLEVIEQQKKNLIAF